LTDLNGKVALVLGGTRGIGRAISEALGAAGASVVVAGRSLATADAVARDMTAAGGSARGIAIDLTEIQPTRQAIDGLVEEVGAIDVLVANAGINPHFARAEELSVEAWDEVFAVNLRGTFFAIQAAGRSMLRAGRGSVVSISSVTAAIGTARGLPYTATKGGMDAMTRTLAVEWAARGVRVNAVAPGYVETDLTAGLRGHDSLSRSIVGSVPLGRFGVPAEIAGLVVYLASDASSYVTGQTYCVDGGMTVARSGCLP
jgi:NAD(P)-dependent dehydrogenase (short-subunit alcohol dehydrogenase family)